MAIRVFITLIATLIAVSFSSVSYAQNSKKCDPGTGQWVLTSGKVQCRKCPKDKEFYPGKAFKMPLGCMAPLAGALLDIGDYEELKSSRDYAVELEHWRINLGPTLDNLHKSVQEAKSNLAVSLKEKKDTLEMLAKLKLQNQVLESQVRTVIITSSVAAVLFCTTLLVGGFN